MNHKINYTILDYENIHELIKEGIDDDLIKILAQIESSYPFTFFEKESLQKKIDKLENYFWIKNKFGYCELLNQKLADFFNSTPLQLEGNHEEMFFPPDFRKFVKSCNNLTSDTKTAILICGLSFGLEENSITLNLINIPIIDAENNVIAIICLSSLYLKEKKDESKENSTFISSNLDLLPFPTAILSEDNTIKRANVSFQKIIGLRKDELENSLINTLFSANFIKILKTFIASSDQRIFVESCEFLQKQGFSMPFLLGKVFDKKNEIIAIFLGSSERFIEKSQPNYSMIENLIRNNPDAVLICDKENLKFLEVNEAATNLYGYRREELLGMDLTDLYLTEDIQILLETSRSNYKEGLFHGPYKHRKKDGIVILVEMSRYSIIFNDREAYFNIIKNITEKLEIEKKSKSFKSVFNHTDDLIFITDSSGLISFVNSSITKILGYTKNDLLNSSFTSIVGDDDRSKVLHLIFNSKKKDESSLELILKTIDGRQVRVELIASPIVDFNNEVESFTLIGKVKQGISNSKIGDKNKTEIDPSLMKKGSEEFDSAFLGDLFHELITPINIILGFSQDITESVSQLTPEKAEAAKIINQNRLLLLHSLNNAFEYASINDKNLNLLVSETKITDVTNELLKDIEEWRKVIHAEFVYGKIATSLKFETDNKRFTFFLLLLFKIVRILSGQEKIYFSAYDHDKNHFLVTFRDLPTHCSKTLVSHLKHIFKGEDSELIKGFGISGIMIRLIKKLLQILNGEYLITAEGRDNSDYGIVFPYVFKKGLIGVINEQEDVEDTNLDKQEIGAIDKSRQKGSAVTHSDKLKSEEKTSAKLDSTGKPAAELQNEIRIESLREKIRWEELQKQQKKIMKDNDDSEKTMDEHAKTEDKIEYIDLDLNETSKLETENQNIEVIETTAPKEKPEEPPVVKRTDEKVDISNLSCLYFEDQVDSQVLFSVQMKGLKNLNFAISFEESLPLLDSGTYDFIVIDLNLQGSYNGLDILKIIRTMPKYENTPIFGVTAYLLPGDEQKFIVAGFNGFISKPIFRDQMIDVLAEVFKESKEP